MRDDGPMSMVFRTSGSIEQARAAIGEGRLDEADHLARHMLAQNGDHIGALEIVAAIARERGDQAEAEANLRRIIELSPGSRLASDMLAELLEATGRIGEAEILWREQVALYPDNAAAHIGLASVLSDPLHLFESGWHLERAIEIVGREPSLLTRLARNLAGRGQLDEAELLVDEAISLDPDAQPPLLLLAEINEQRGTLEAAGAAIDRAETLATGALRDLAGARVALLARGSAWREALARLDADSDPDGVTRLLRGRLRQRAERYGEAWDDFVAAKAAIATESGVSYDRAFVETHFSAVVRAFSAPFWESVPRAGVRTDVPQPIFVLGFPRSGTTMIEQVLTSHGQIRGGGELPFVSQMRDFAARLLGRGLPFPAGIGELAAADFHHMPALFRDLYLARAGTRGLTAPGVRFFTDKMPLNETWLPLMRLAFPEAPMILVRRHPFDVLVSVLSHDMTHGFNCGYRLADAAHQLAAVSQLTVHYRDRLGCRTHDLVYEHFVTNQDEETARLMAYVGLDPEPAQLRFHESARHAPTPSYAQVKEPVHSRAVERWRHYADQLAPALRLVTPALRDGGYLA